MNSKAQQDLTWISVEKNLPERGKFVDVLIKGNILMKDVCLLHNDWYSNVIGVFDSAGDPTWNLEKKITHWRPLAK